MADVLSDDDIEIIGGCDATHPEQWQHVDKMCPGVRVMSRSLGIGVTVTSERSQHANKAAALRLLRMIVTAKLEEDRPYVCPGCHAVAPERCLPGCLDAEIEAEREAREYEASEDDEP